MEFGEVFRDQVLNDLKFFVKDFKFYPKSNGKPWIALNWTVWWSHLYLRKVILSVDWEKNQNRCGEIRWEVIIIVQVGNDDNLDPFLHDHSTTLLFSNSPPYQFFLHSQQRALINNNKGNNKENGNHQVIPIPTNFSLTSAIKQVFTYSPITSGWARLNPILICSPSPFSTSKSLFLLLPALFWVFKLFFLHSFLTLGKYS